MTLISRDRVNYARNLIAARPHTPSQISRGVILAREAIANGAMQKRSEFAPFLTLALKQQPRSVVEIGLGLGGTLWALCRVAQPDATIVSVDMPDGPYGGDASATLDPDEVRARALPTQTIHLIRGDSRNPDLIEETRRLAQPIDLLFIDGDHTYDGVKADFENYSPLVRSGGLIGFHDILPCDNYPESQVHTFWNEIEGRKVALTSESEMNNHFGGRWGGIGVLVKA